MDNATMTMPYEHNVSCEYNVALNKHNVVQMWLHNVDIMLQCRCCVRDLATSPTSPTAPNTPTKSFILLGKYSINSLIKI